MANIQALERPVMVATQIDTATAGNVLLRWARVPDSRITHYQVARADQPNLFDFSKAGEDYFHIAYQAQPASTEILAEAALTSQATDQITYYAVRATNGSTDPTLVSAWAQLPAFVYYFKGEVHSVPQFPFAPTPDYDILKGVVRDSNVADLSAGFTHHQLYSYLEAALFEKLLPHFAAYEDLILRIVRSSNLQQWLRAEFMLKLLDQKSADTTDDTIGVQVSRWEGIRNLAAASVIHNTMTR